MCDLSTHCLTCLFTYSSSFTRVFADIVLHKDPATSKLVLTICISILNLLSLLQVDVIYSGLLLKDDRTLESYGLKDNAIVYIIYREPNLEGNIPIFSCVTLRVCLFIFPLP